MKPKERIEAQHKLWHMILVGVTLESACKELGINRQTGYNWLEAKRKDATQELVRNADHVIAEMEEGRKKRMKQLWDIVYQSTNEKDKMMAMALLQKEEDLKQRAMIQLGVLQPASNPIIAIQQNNVTQTVTTISDAFKKHHPDKLQLFGTTRTLIPIEKHEETQ